ncbi:MAG: TIGR02452 family protein [Spirochaetales bacterium]|nr:TIGR02452 family protein [Spirochaetales bacterium]
MYYHSDRRDRLTEIFADTKNQYETQQSLIAACKYSTSHQSYIGENDVIPSADAMKAKYNDNAQVIISQKRTFEAASAYASKGIITCVHNFASSMNPGGGVKHGSSAQEECLCRCSTLYYSLNSRQSWDKFYTPHRQGNLSGLHNDDIIYTPSVKVFKSDIDFPEILSEDKWYNVNVITCAAPDLNSCREDGQNVSPAELSAVHQRRLRRILDTALINGNEAVILGAFGCGAFGNPPQLAATAAKSVIADYLHAFRFIEFAVYCTPKHIENYEIFKKVLG